MKFSNSYISSIYGDHFQGFHGPSEVTKKENKDIHKKYAYLPCRNGMGSEVAKKS